MKQLYTLIVICFTIFYANAQFTDVTPSDFPQIVMGGSGEWLDMDNDGDLDLVGTGNRNAQHAREAFVYINNGDDKFVHMPVTIGGYGFSDIAASDYNNDNWMDFLIGGNAEGAGVAKLYNSQRGDGFEYEERSSFPYVMSVSFAWGDYDNDGDEDVFITGTGKDAQVTGIYENKGKGKFKKNTRNDFVPSSQGAAKWGDYDNDGDLDILYTGYAQTAHTWIYTNLGDGKFERLKTANLVGMNAGHVAWGDYDNDGDLDIFLMGWDMSGRAAKHAAYLYTNKGNGIFEQNLWPDETYVLNSSAAWGDYNNDGYLDLLLTGANNGNSVSRSSVYINNTDSEFERLETQSLRGAYTSKGRWGDYDSDGDLDVLIVGGWAKSYTEKQHPPNASIFRNDIERKNTQPKAPKGLSANVHGKTVVLSWAAGKDKETPTKGLTYNIYIGTKKNKASICSPMANIKTGKRSVARMGNVQLNTKWKIKNLPKGKYYWSVQTVDTSFEGSKFAKEGSFVVK